MERFVRSAHLIGIFRFVRRDLGPWSPWVRFKQATAALDAFLYEEIASRRRETSDPSREDVLSLLLGVTTEEGSAMSDLELRNELFALIVAGFETTAIALTWTFERLLRNPTVLRRLTSSLAEGDEYLDAVIKETLRMRPVLPAARSLTKDIELAGYLIPARTVVIPATAAVHFREDPYPEPDKFRAERFLEGIPKNHVWIPFGGGVRRCVGAALAQLEVRVIIRAILERTELRAEDLVRERPRLDDLVVVPKRGCRVVLTKRLDPPRTQACGDSSTIQTPA
jgi:cytochrome P450